MRRDETTTMRSVATVYGYGPDGKALGCFSVAIEYAEGRSIEWIEAELEERCEERIEARWIEGFPGVSRDDLVIEAEVDHGGGE